MWPRKDDGQHRTAVVKEMAAVSKDYEAYQESLKNEFAASPGYGASGSPVWYTKTTSSSSNPWQLDGDPVEAPYDDDYQDPVEELTKKVEEMNDKMEAAWELINDLAAVIDSMQEDS